MMKKRICSVFLVIAILFINCSVISANDWTTEYSEEIQRGVVYKTILKYLGESYSKLHVLECDLSDPGVSIGIMTASKGSSYLENTKKMAENNGALAAVNGDFFNVGSERTNMLGVVYQEGEMISTPSKDTWATFAITEAGKVLMDYFGFQGMIISPQGYKAEIYQINKKAVTGGSINVFTKKWGSTVYCGDNMEALLIKDGKVTGKVRKKGDISFGDNDTMLLVNYTVNGFFNNFNDGDKIKLEYSLTGTTDKIKEATGGNTILVADGKKAKFTHNATGFAQRTAIGIDSTGKKLYIAVCEGRQAKFIGMTQDQMAEAMIELGCVRAINLDGGGSSTMVVKNSNSGNVDVKNNVSSLRSVSTSVGVFNKSEYIGIPVSGEINSDKSILKGDYVDIYYRFIDENAHLVYPDSNHPVVITTTDETAVIKGNRVIFNKSGKHKVYASFRGVTAETEIMVIGDVASAMVFPEEITVSKGGTVKAGLVVWDAEGNKAYVHPENVTWVSSGVSVNSGVVGYGTGYVGVEFAEASAYASVNGGKVPQNKFKNTKLMTESVKTGEVVRISAGSEDYSSIANMIRTINYENTLGGAKYLYMFNPPRVKNLKYISAYDYSSKEIGGTLITSLKISSGSINHSWQMNHLKALPDLYDKKNIIIIIEKSPLTLPAEEQAFFIDSILKAKNNGKNVFIVCKDTKTHSYVENGIYYIGCSTIKGVDFDEGNEYFNKKKTVEFYISGNDIRYSIKN